jgi:hypothetical protein
LDAHTPQTLIKLDKVGTENAAAAVNPSSKHRKLLPKLRIAPAAAGKYKVAGLERGLPNHSFLPLMLLTS